MVLTPFTMFSGVWRRDHLAGIALEHILRENITRKHWKIASKILVILVLFFKSSRLIHHRALLRIQPEAIPYTKQGRRRSKIECLQEYKLSTSCWSHLCSPLSVSVVRRPQRQCDRPLRVRRIESVPHTLAIVCPMTLCEGRPECLASGSQKGASSCAYLSVRVHVLSDRLLQTLTQNGKWHEHFLPALHLCRDAPTHQGCLGPNDAWRWKKKDLQLYTCIFGPIIAFSGRIFIVYGNLFVELTSE